MSEQDAIQPTEEEALISALNDEGAEQKPNDSDGLEELEIGPDKLRVDRRVKEYSDGLQRKVQETVESTKADKAQVAKERAEMAETAKLHSALIDEISELKWADKQLADYKEFKSADDWVRLKQTQPEQYDYHWPRYQALVAQRPLLLAAAQQRAADLQAKTTQQTTQQRDQAERELTAKIKDWSPAKKAEIAGHAKALGFSNEEFEGVATDPRVITVLAEVAEYRALKAKAKAAASKKPDEPPPEPSAKLPTAGNSGPTPLSDRQNMNDWTKQFLKDRAKHQNRR